MVRHTGYRALCSALNQYALATFRPHDGACKPVTTFLLIRHASHGLLGTTLAGRMEGVPLSPSGTAEAEALAGRLADLPLHAIYSSPVERALRTAEPLARRCSLDITIESCFSEIDFGDWTGRTFDALRDLPEWRRFNSVRSCTRPPGGETMLEVQARVAAGLERLSLRHGEGAVGVVTHGDVIKAALMYYLGAPLDLFDRFEISPASVSVVRLRAEGPRVLCINSPGDLPPIT